MPNSYGTPISADNLVEGRTYIFKSKQPGEGAFVFKGMLESKTGRTVRFIHVHKLDGSAANTDVMKLIPFTFDFFNPPAEVPGPGMGGHRRMRRKTRKSRKSRSRKTRRRV